MESTGVLETEEKTYKSIAINLLEVFQTICDAHNLRYFAIGGTCIGAVRHKGFIPWDDDLDVAMPREDYNKFIEACKKELPEGYGIIGPYNCRHYTANYIKLQDLNTTFIEEIAKMFPDRFSGVYIDIFPIDGLPKNNLLRNIVAVRCTIQNHLNIRMRFPFSYEKGMAKKILWIGCFPLRILLPYDYFCREQEKMLSKYTFDNSDKILFSWREIPTKRNKRTYKNIFFFEDFRKGMRVPFENKKIDIPCGYDRYLTMDFGKYMELPPVEKRVGGHPKAILDFSKPFSAYKHD